MDLSIRPTSPIGSSSRRLWLTSPHLSIQTKILIPLSLLMLLSLVGSALGFLISTNSTRNQILDDQIGDDRRRFIDAWQRRSQDLGESASLLAEDSSFVTALQQDSQGGNHSALLNLDQRAVSTRERYELDQVLVINSSGQVRVNITTQSSMSRSDVVARLSALPAASAGAVVLLEDEHHSLLVGRARVWPPDSADRRGPALGTIYTVLDISSETGRLRRSLELQSALQLTAGRVVAATLPELQGQALAPDRRDALLSDGGRYRVLTSTFSLGNTSVKLALLRSEEAINAIVFAGFQVMLVSSGVTLLLLLLLGVVLARSLTQPIRTLASVASAFAAGDLNRRARLDTLDEIGQLGHALDHAADTITLLLDQQAQNLGELQAILTSIADGVLAIDARSVIVQVNPAALALLGREADALVGRPLDLLLQSDEIDLVDGLHQIVGQLREELTDATLSVTEGRVTLGPRVLALRSAPIVSGGAPRGAVMVLQDITAAVIAEQIKSDFIAVASHELRTPLTSLKGHLDLLFLLDTSNLTSEQRTSITTVRRQTNNLIQLVNDLLEMARIEQGRLIAEREWINPFYMLGEVVLELEPGARARGIQLDWQVGKGLPPLWIDRLHLRRIVINLITNAVKYSHDNSLVSVRAYELDDPALLPSRPADPHWHHHDQRSIVIEVEDQGVGIRAEDQASIFTRFFRSPNPRSTEAGGTGLGLTITQALVMLHSGQIGFRSAEGVGSCFWVRLPVVNLAPVDGLSWNMLHAQAPIEQR